MAYKSIYQEYRELSDRAYANPRIITEDEVLDLYFGCDGPGYCVLDDDMPDHYPLAFEWFEEEYGRPDFYDGF